MRSTATPGIGCGTYIFVISSSFFVLADCRAWSAPTTVWRLSSTAFTFAQNGQDRSVGELRPPATPHFAVT
jgi:hypothetical protein